MTNSFSPAILIIFKVWLCVLVTTAVFVLVSAIIIKNRANINDQNSSRQLLLHTIYNQLDFVFRLFTNQGKTLIGRFTLFKNSNAKIFI